MNEINKVNDVQVEEVNNEKTTETKVVNKKKIAIIAGAVVLGIVTTIAIVSGIKGKGGVEDVLVDNVIDADFADVTDK